jgi:anti-sigma regulatory factor (Ser/Thr protein kinase)
MSPQITTNGNHEPDTRYTALQGGDRFARDRSDSELSVRFERGPTAACAARHALLALEPRIDGKVLDDIRLLVSELVTNAIRHAHAPDGGKVGVDVSVKADSVHVEVADPGSGFEPQPRDGSMTRPGGWGLYLVDRIADRWGVISAQQTRVWFEIDSGAHVAA